MVTVASPTPAPRQNQPPPAKTPSPGSAAGVVVVVRPASDRRGSAGAGCWGRLPCGCGGGPTLASGGCVGHLAAGRLGVGDGGHAAARCHRGRGPGWTYRTEYRVSGPDLPQRLCAEVTDLGAGGGVPGAASGLPVSVPGVVQEA